MIRYADFSSCKTRRYALRITDFGVPSNRVLLTILLNPPEADEGQGNRITSFLIRLAQREGCGRYEAVNIFSLIAANPRTLYTHEDPVGPDNDKAILAAAARADHIIVGWGNHGNLHDRAEHVLELLTPYHLSCFGTNINGTPRFPFAIRSDVELVTYREAASTTGRAAFLVR